MTLPEIQQVRNRDFPSGIVFFRVRSERPPPKKGVQQYTYPHASRVPRFLLPLHVRHTTHTPTQQAALVDVVIIGLDRRFPQEVLADAAIVICSVDI